MIFLDTSVLIAAVQDFHLDHTASFARVSAASPTRASTSIHCLTEFFSILTRLPKPYRLSPSSALGLVEQMRDHFTILHLNSTETLQVMRAFAANGFAGGMLYDATLMACARKAKASRIYTLNLRHFKMLAPDLSTIISAP